MDKIEIIRNGKLKGEVSASGAKNSILPLLFSTLLADGKHTFHNVPKVQDVHTSLLLLENFGCQVEWIKSNSLCIDVPKKIKTYQAPYELMRTMRAGVLSLGPLLAKYGRSEVSLPGGCAIGTRSVDWHIKNLQKLGADIRIENGYILGRNSIPLKGAQVVFEKSTVGGTQNLLMASCLSAGTTTIHQAAKEPEVVDLVHYLKKMGARIQNEGTDIITIEGVKSLTPAEHTVIPDRIEVGTLLMAAAITKGEIKITHCIPQHLEIVIEILQECGFEIETGEDWIFLSSPSNFKAHSINTAPYPGFPTDLQAQFMVLMTQAQGQSSVQESIFENRFMHVPELLRLNADIIIKQNTAVINGPTCLTGAFVTATDLRASSCLILAGLVASSKTTIKRVYHLDRGYEKLEEKLRNLRANVKRLS